MEYCFDSASLVCIWLSFPAVQAALGWEQHITFEEGGNVPGSDPTLLHELPQGHLQKENGDPPDKDD